MQETHSPASIHLGHPVWPSLSLYDIGPANAALPFGARLARENGWSDAFTARVIEEYRRFCFLAVTGEEEMTPSDAVDQAWHLHLTYSRDYWERFCPDILGKPLHHGPTTGDAGARGHYFERYARTLLRYEQVFGTPAPADIWPDGARRLIDDPRARRVHPRDAIILPRATVRRLVACAILIGIAILFLVPR